MVAGGATKVTPATFVPELCRNIDEKDKTQRSKQNKYPEYTGLTKEEMQKIQTICRSERMAFKRSAVRSCLSPSNSVPETRGFRYFFVCKIIFSPPPKKIVIFQIRTETIIANLEALS